MNADHPVRLALIVVLFALGLLVAVLRPGPGGGADSPLRAVFWLERRADLLVQLGLMIVGALGIRALLPSADEELEDDDDLVA